MPTTPTTTGRINRGRNHSYKLDGEPTPGVTTIIGDGVPKPALSYWAAKMAAEFTADNLDTLNGLDRFAIVDLVKGAPWRDRDAAARRGTEVHRLGEQLVAGEEIEVPEELTGHVDAYLRFLDDWQLDPVLVEAVVVNRTHRYLGTLDLVADLNDGHRWLLDIKTTRSGVYGETALQLSAYRHAEHYLDEDGNEQPMPEVDRTGVIWVRADGYDLVPVDTGPDIYRYFRAAQHVAHFAKHIAPVAVGEALRPQVTA
jgi:hypothetical protein